MGYNTMWYTKLHDLVAAAAAAGVPLWHRDCEMPHQRTRRGVEARLAPSARGVPLEGGVTAFCWGSRFGARLRIRRCVLGTTTTSRFRMMSESSLSFDFDVRRRCIGDEVGREDLLKGDAAVVLPSFPFHLLLLLLLLLQLQLLLGDTMNGSTLA